MNIIIPFLFMLSFVILANYGIHVYYKKKRKILFEEIGSRSFIEIKNIKTEICAKRMLSYSFQFFTSDVILFEKSILLLLRNYSLNGLIDQNQRIIEISKNRNAKELNGVGRIYVLQKEEFLENKVKMYSEQNLMVNAKFEIILDFENRIEELNSIKNYIYEHFD